MQLLWMCYLFFHSWAWAHCLQAVVSELWYVEEFDVLALALNGRMKTRKFHLGCSKNWWYKRNQNGSERSFKTKKKFYTDEAPDRRRRSHVATWFWFSSSIFWNFICLALLWNTRVHTNFLFMEFMVYSSVFLIVIAKNQRKIYVRRG